MKTYIAATDFSQEAENALEYCCSLAAMTNARVVIFNSFHLPLHTANAILSAGAINDLENINRKLLVRTSEDLARKHHISVDYKLDYMEDVSLQLENLFEEEKAEIIVMGMASKSLAQDIFGNTTTSAIMKMKYPVLAVPAEVKFKPLKKILFACDKAEKIPHRVLERIKLFAQALKAEIEIFHVEDGLENAEEEVLNLHPNLKENFSSIPHTYKNLQAKEIISAIENEAARTKADLLIMLPQKYGFWESLLHRSKTRMMASGAGLPLLSIPL